MTRSTFGRYRAGPAILADGHIGENALGDRDLLLAGAAPHPALHFHCDRGCPDLDDFGITGHLVADETRTMKGHGGDRPGPGAGLGAAGWTAARPGSHLRPTPSPTNMGR